MVSKRSTKVNRLLWYVIYILLMVTMYGYARGDAGHVAVVYFFLLVIWPLFALRRQEVSDITGEKIIAALENARGRIANLEAENAELRKDRERLEWMVKNEACAYWVDDCAYGICWDGENILHHNWRDAIDEARSGE